MIYPVLRASTIFMRAGLTAGSSPPTSPMNREKAMALRIFPGVRVKEKAGSGKVRKLMAAMG